jgi:serine/threonine protein kinase, bacterial
VEGTPFGRYLLVERFGPGGKGEVWRAYDTATNNRIVAIKLLPQDLAGDSAFVQRFRREAEAAAQLNNPHIIPIHSYGEIDGRLYVEMGLVEGRGLNEVLAGGPLEPVRAVRIIEQVAEALQAAHRIGVMHRDVKPSNILLDEHDFAYLTDFGIARGADETGLIGIGAMIGSWYYMAPERFRAGEADVRADVYALACLLYQCLTGCRPFPGDSLESQFAAHLADPPPRPSITQPDVPARFDAVIAKGMAKEPDDRYAATVELADAARDAITVPVPRPTPGPAPDPPTEQAGSVAQQPIQLGPTQPTGAPTAAPTPATVAPSGRGLSRWAMIAAAVAAVVVVGAVVTILAVVGHPSFQKRTASQVVLPFTGLRDPYGVAVDSSGNVYLADAKNNRVLKLPAGSKTQIELPFTGLKNPSGVAVDAAGTVYITDYGKYPALKLSAGPGALVEALPFTGLDSPIDVAVDSSGNVYIADSNSNRVLKLPAGSNTPVELPFTGLRNPSGVAVDTAANVYISDYGNNRVVKLPAGSNTLVTLPFSGLNFPEGVAVDTAGNVYVTDYWNNRVLKLPAGSNTPVELPFTGLNHPEGVAVDNAGNIYMTDWGNFRVLKLPAK